jgi:hypothetical protein
MEKEGLYLSFEYPLYTDDYSKKCHDLLTEYNELKDNVDCIRSDDPDYEEPSLWYLSDELSKIQDDNVSNLTFEFILL